MRVAVTGGAGFIGANLCRMLDSDAGVEQVIALDDLSTGSRDNLRGLSRVELLQGSILDRASLDAAFAGADAVVHLAARASVPRSIADPRASHEANATGTLEVLEAVRRAGNPHLIVASSSSVYGANPALPKTEDLAPAPLSPYAASKLATEAYASAYAAAFDVPTLVFRFFNVFGPLQPAGHAYAAVIPAFVSAAVEGRPLVVHGDGLQTRDFTYVGTVASVLADALRRRVCFAVPVNLAFGSRISLLELIGLLEGLVGRSLPRQHTDPRPGDVRDSQADQTRLQSLFPDINAVPIEDGLRSTVDWFRAAAALS